MTNLFRTVNRKLEDSPVIILVMLFAFCGLIAGGLSYGEDYISSYLGVQEIEQRFSVVPATFAFMYFVVSAVPQLGSTIFGYIYLSDTSQRWAMVTVAILETIDFSVDLYHRADHGRILSAAWAYVVDGIGDSQTMTALAFAALLTFFYSVFSVILFVSSAGLLLEGFTPAVVQFAKAYSGVKIALKKAREAVNGATQNERRQPNGNQQNAPQEIRPAQPVRDPQRSQAQQQRRGQ